MDFPEIFSNKLRLRTGEYKTPKIANISDKQAIVVGMYATAVTNATSKFPVIGTDALCPCCAVIAYNTKTKTAALTHIPTVNGQAITEMLAKVRTNNDDLVHMHLIGTPKDERITVTDSNTMFVHCLTEALEAIVKQPNVHLKTFDVYDKLKPHSVGIDTRSGGLIRGSKLLRTQQEASKDMDDNNSLFSGWCESENMGKADFDGTAKKFQRAKGGPAD